MEIFITIIGVHALLWLIGLPLILTSRRIDHDRKNVQLMFTGVVVIVGPLVAIAIHLIDRFKPLSAPDKEIGNSINDSNAT